MKKILSLLLLFFSTSLFATTTAPIEERPVLILGGGSGGLTAATYLARAGVPPVVIAGPIPGGAITQSHNVENWPGDLNISGTTLADKLQAQAAKNGADIRSETAISVDFTQYPYYITTKDTFSGSLKHYTARTCIIAMGATPNTLHVPGEQQYWANGVYTCAVCDGGLYKDKVVAIVGGGDAALLEAQYLSNLAKEVHLIVRKPHFRTVEKQRMEQILSHANIRVHYETIVQEIKGDGTQVTGVMLQAKAQVTPLPVDALFLAIGAQPNTALFQGQLALDPHGYILLKNTQETSLPGVYAIGDVSDPHFKQAVCASGDGAKAALQAQEYLAAHPIPQPVADKREVMGIDSVAQLEAVIAQAKGPVFIDFYADYCGPCRTFAPLYANWAKKYGNRIAFLKVDTNKVTARALCEQYQIRALPTLLILDEKGHVVQKWRGLGEIGAVEKKLERYQQVPEMTARDF